MVFRRDAKTVYTSPAAAVIAEQHPRELYRLLRWYYQNNGLYDELYQALYAVGQERRSLRPLRNPANRVVEFYAAKLWPGQLHEAFDITAGQKEEIIPAIHQVWQWSNWEAQKQVTARWFASYGDLFLKVVQSQDRDRVYFQALEPEYVTDFDTDERGYLIYIRIDVPRQRREGDEVKGYTHTEVWDKATQTYRVWEHTQPEDTELRRLGRPVVEEDMKTFGIDFLPFVHAKFRDVGEARGVSAFTHALDKIDEANRMATRLHQMLFRHNDTLWVLEANAVDGAGRPMPAPSLPTDNKGEVVLGNSRIARLPGNAKLSSLVPQLQYEAALLILDAMMDELQRDLPELAYYALREQTAISGRAVRLLLGDALDKAEEARGNALAALKRANEMALTIGAHAKLKDFKAIGTWENGDYDHTIELPPIIPLTEAEDLETLQIKREALEVPIETLWEEAGYSEEDIATMKALREQGNSLGERLLRNFETQFGGGA